MSTRQRGSTPARSAVTATGPRKRHDLAEIGIRLLDEAHVAWQRAERECEHALRTWYDGPPRACTANYLSYRSALEREHAAANDLQRMWQLATSGHEALAAAYESEG